MDELAEKLDLDPIELRIRNEPTEDPEKHIPYSSRHLIPCFQEGARRFGWGRRNAKPGQSRDGRWLVGMGVAAATRGNPLELSKANVRLGSDGLAVVRMAMTDIGTGTYTILTQIAAEMLGLPTERIRVELGDTNFPYASGSGGSFGAASSGSASVRCLQQVESKAGEPRRHGARQRPASRMAGLKPPVNPGRSWTSSVPKASTPTARLDLAPRAQNSRSNRMARTLLKSASIWIPARSD